MTLTEVRVITLEPNKPEIIEYQKNELVKIESAGLGGTRGVIYLRDLKGDNIATLFNSVNQGKYSSALPFWIAGFKGSIMNESAYNGCVSISYYTL